MKKFSETASYRMLFLLSFVLVQVMAWGQDSTDRGSNNVMPDSTDTVNNTVTGSTDWYTQPWVWAVAGVVVLLIIIALLRGGKRKDVNVARTTVIKKNEY